MKKLFCKHCASDLTPREEATLRHEADQHGDRVPFVCGTTDCAGNEAVWLEPAAFLEG